jgi:hypothetical protein
VQPWRQLRGRPSVLWKRNLITATGTECHDFVDAAVMLRHVARMAKGVVYLTAHLLISDLQYIDFSIK